MRDRCLRRCRSPGRWPRPNCCSTYVKHGEAWRKFGQPIHGIINSGSAGAEAWATGQIRLRRCGRALTLARAGTLDEQDTVAGWFAADEAQRGRSADSIDRALGA